MAQPPQPFLVDDVQLDTDPIMSPLKKFLSDPSTREVIDRARSLGGWEGWLQVQLALYLKDNLTLADTAREGQDFTNPNQHVDLWVAPSAFAPRSTPASFIELKVQCNKEDARTLPARLSDDIDNFLNGTRTFKNEHLGALGMVYCIGLMTELADCTGEKAGGNKLDESLWKKLYDQYPGIQLFYWRQEPPKSAGFTFAKPQYLIWWRMDMLELKNYRALHK